MAATGWADLNPGSKASFLALAGVGLFVVGVILAPLLGAFAFFFVALGGFAVVASPIIWVLLKWDARSAG